MRKQMRAPALLADSALNTGVHYGCPHHDDDDEFTPMPFVFDIDDDNATEYDGSDADCVSQLINMEIQKRNVSKKREENQKTDLKNQIKISDNGRVKNYVSQKGKQSKNQIFVEFSDVFFQLK